MTFRCLHQRCTEPRKRWHDFRRHFEPNWQPNRRAKSKAARLVDLATKQCELFMTPDGQPYATFRQDRLHTQPIKATAFRRWLADLGERQLAILPSRKVLDDVVLCLEARATRGTAAEVYLRCARVNETIFIDLANQKGEVVQITAEGWKVISDCPVKFVRTENMAPLPTPEHSGSWDELWQFVNVAPDERPVVRGFILDTLKGAGPYMTALVGGEQGSAKSTLCKVLRSLIDPVHKAPLRRLPRDEYDLTLAAEKNALCAFDNVSSLPQWLSDAVAALNTGTGFGTRKLWSQDEEHVYGVARPVVLNGIPDLCESADLLDRAVKITCPPIPGERKKDEDELEVPLRAARPRILGAVFDSVAAGLKNYGAVKLGQRSRMARSERWIAACELGSTMEGEFLAAYHRNREELTTLAIDNSVTATILLTWLEGRKGATWDGTATDLLIELSEYAPSLVLRSASFPKVPHKLSGELRRVAPALRKVGVQVELVRTKKRRGIRITSDNGSKPKGADEQVASQEMVTAAPEMPTLPTRAPTLPELTGGRLPFLLDYDVNEHRDGSASVHFRKLTDGERALLDPATESSLGVLKTGRMSFQFRKPTGFRCRW
jgi:hypothetical protein